MPMQPDDEFFATIRVRYTGQTTCGGGREFEDVPNYNYSFDEGEFESLTPVPRQLPTKPGSIIKIEAEGGDPVVAVLRDDGMWTTSRSGSFATLSSTFIEGFRWRSLT